MNRHCTTKEPFLPSTRKAMASFPACLACEWGEIDTGIHLKRHRNVSVVLLQNSKLETKRYIKYDIEHTEEDGRRGLRVKIRPSHRSPKRSWNRKSPRQLRQT